MKKICFIGGYGGGKDCIQRLCGPQRLYVELAQRLKNDYRVYFLHVGENDLLYSANSIKGILIKKGAFSFVKSLKALQQLNPDVIHGYGSLNMGLLLFFYKKWFRKKTILTFTDFKKNITKNYRLLNALDWIIVQTEYARTTLIRKGVKSSKILKVAHGIEDDFYKAKECRQIRSIGKKIALYYGDARRERGFPILLEALKYLNKDITVLFCLRKFEKGFSASALLSQKKENVVMMAVKDYPCPIQDIIKSCDFVVLPFIKNTLEPPLTLMEVSAVGTPLITTNVGGNKEVAAREAMVLNKINPRILADAINQFSKKKVHPKNKFYPWNKAVEELKRIY